MCCALCEGVKTVAKEDAAAGRQRKCAARLYEGTLQRVAASAALHGNALYEVTAARRRDAQQRRGVFRGGSHAQQMSSTAGGFSARRYEYAQAARHGAYSFQRRARYRAARGA